MLLSFVLSTLLAASIALPGGPPVGMDYLAYDQATGRIWVPAGNTGNVDVVDVATGKVTTVSGFPTAPARRPGRPRMGPSSAAVGDGVVWIGNRANNEICAVDARTLARGPCHRLPSMPDGLAYVAATHEVWVTTPGDRSITVVDVSGKGAVHRWRSRSTGIRKGGGRRRARPLLHERRGQGSDAGDRRADQEGRGQLAGRLRRRRATRAGARRSGGACCSSPAPTARSRATSAHVVREERSGGSRPPGGVDNIDYAPKRGLLFVASGLGGTLTVARVGDTGALSAVTSIPTAQGARCVVVAADGTAFVADSAGGRLIVVKPPPLAAALPATVRRR